ncbi:DDB1- and CUL4-associated factor 10-like [Artemia franciscana]|uniref:DDB1- and CUL4-associated factor 10 homolog n=1 Tax=Artemia franciscana TaxID=6661 RepID=A0AA88HD97_ARTSF|nr:hypothetical protein QYM36_013047 [Artemia franciscana]
MKLWNSKKSFFAPQGPLLAGRELGRRGCIGQEDALFRDLYTSCLPCSSWDFGRDSSFGYHGGIFNLEFSPDGKILVAACEQRSFITFDPLTHKPIHCVENAHLDCVNCVRFLDSRTFATCSDDTTIGLWDVRNLRQRITSLKGHSNWVKNIEYAQKDGLLITSGFDGSVYAWNINNYTNEGVSHSRVFHSNGLMRMRLTPDASKMVLCTTNGYLMIVHDLDLKQMAEDLAGFKPNMYRLMQISQTPIPFAMTSSHLFTAKRNRVELITDFPVGNDAEVISSLQIHPHGWCAVSRNTSSDEQSEWTCVHDIQTLSKPPKCGKRSREFDDGDDQDRSKRSAHSASDIFRDTIPEPVLRTGPELGSSVSLIDETASDSDENDIFSSPNDLEDAISRMSDDSSGLQGSLVIRYNGDERSFGGESNSTRYRFTLHSAENASNPVSHSSPNSSRGSIHLESPGGPVSDTNQRGNLFGRGFQVRIRAPLTLEERADGPIEFRLRSSGDPEPTRDLEVHLPNLEYLEALQAIRSRRSRMRDDRSRFSRRPSQRQIEMIDLSGASTSAVFVQAATNFAARTAMYQHSVERRPSQNYDLGIHKNTTRLTHYLEEPNVGRGFIKELCFSNDGRVVASPFGYGVRLLAFDKDCSEMSHSLEGWNQLPVKLREISGSVCHTNVVVSTQFSPIHCMLVSGCLNGKIVWHQPIM